MFRRLVSAVAAGVAAVALLAVAPVPAYADGDLSVIWPEATAVNPDVSDYVITVADTGPGELVARWLWQSQPIPHNGQATLTLNADGHGQVEIWRCESGTCIDTGVGSPFLEVHGAIDNYDPIVLVRHARNPGSWQIEAESGFPGLTGVTYDWTLRTETDDVVGTGSVADSGGETFDVPAPAGLAEGAYLLDIDVRGTFVGAPIHSASTQTVSVYVDLTPPAVETPMQGPPWLLPYDDDLGLLTFVVSTGEWGTTYEAEVLTDEGERVGPPTDTFTEGGGASFVPRWNGRVDGVVSQPGYYRFFVTATDEAGNTSVGYSPRFLLDYARRRTITRSTTRRAADVVVDSTVGRCSALTQPSSHGWTGSLGLHSQAWCDATTKGADAVEVEHALRLPIAGRDAGRLWLRDNITRVRLEAYGGPARGHRSGSQMRMALVGHDGRTGHLTRCGGALLWCSTGNLTRSPARWISRKGGDNVVRWTSTVSGGSRYDVKAYRLTVRATAFVEPDGTIFWPR